MLHKFTSLIIVTSLLASCGTTQAPHQEASKLVTPPPIQNTIAQQKTISSLENTPQTSLTATLNQKDALELESVKQEWDEASRLLEAGKKNEAILILEEITKKLPNSLIINHALMELYGDSKNWEKANMVADKIITQTEPIVPSLNKLSLDVDMLTTAYTIKAIYSKNIMKDDILTLAYLKNGLALLNEQESTFNNPDMVAQGRKERAIDLNLKSAMIYEKQKQYNLAVESYGKLISLMPENNAFYLRRSALNNELGNYNAVLNDVNHVFESPNEKPLIVYLLRALAYSELGETEKSRQDIESFNKLHDGNDARIITRNGKKVVQIGRDNP